MTSDIVIRLAEPADLAALGRLGAELVRAHHRFDARRFIAPTGDIEAGYARFLGDQLDQAGSVIYVAARGDALLGYVYAGLEPASWKELRGPAGFIHDLLVEPPARGQGVAKRLLAAAAAWLEQRGAPRLVLWTAHHNDAARRLFAGLGFRPTMVEMTREVDDERGAPQLTGSST